jgi:Zn-dependent protease with chaperone function
MSNPFYYLAGLLLVAAYPLGIEPLRFARTPVAPWAALGAVAGFALLSWAVLSRRPHRPGLARFLLRFVALALYAALLFVFHFPLWIWSLGAESDPLLSTFGTLAPLFALYGVLAIAHDRAEPYSGGLRFAFRSFLGLSFTPLLLMMLLDEVLSRADWVGRLVFVYPAAGWILALGGLSLLMIVLPPILRLILNARPLPVGPLRDRLTQRCAEIGFPVSELLVVPTGTSRMANAFVAGLSIRWRYVFFTRAILEGMTPDELDCVLVHEITHAQKRHILFYLVAALAFSLCSGLVHEALDSAGVPSVVLLTGMLAWAGLYWGVAFGFVSRRFETEADLVAARRVPGLEGGLAPYAAARKMAAALERVAALNGVPIWAPSWRHFRIDQRIDILLRAELDPAVGLRFEGVCDRLRLAALVLVAAGILSGGLLLRLQHRQAGENRSLLEAHETAERGYQALLEGRYESALADLRRGIEGGSASARVWIWKADAERALGREEEARRSEETARRKGYTDPRLRLRLPP